MRSLNALHEANTLQSLTYFVLSAVNCNDYCKTSRLAKALIFYIVVQASQEWVENGELVAASQLAVEQCLSPGCGWYSALSLDSIRHAVRALTRMGAATRTTR